MNPEAIEAAAEALEKRSENDDWEWCLGDAKAALEAAAPYLVREARAAELEAVAEEWEAVFPETVVSAFVTGVMQCAKSLRDRAAAIRAEQ